MKQFKRYLWASVLGLVLLAGGVTYAYISLTARWQATVQEPLSWVGSSSFTDILYPKQTVSHNLTLANAYSGDSYEVDVAFTAIPGGLTISVPNKITVPAGGVVTFAVSITASKSAPPGEHTVDFTFSR